MSRQVYKTMQRVIVYLGQEQCADNRPANNIRHLEVIGSATVYISASCCHVYCDPIQAEGCSYLSMAASSNLWVHHDCVCMVIPLNTC